MHCAELTIVLIKDFFKVLPKHIEGLFLLEFVGVRHISSLHMQDLSWCLAIDDWTGGQHVDERKHCHNLKWKSTQ